MWVSDLGFESAEVGAMLTFKKIGILDVCGLIGFFSLAGMVIQVWMWRIQLGYDMGTVFGHAVSNGQPVPRLEGVDVYIFFLVFSTGMLAQCYGWLRMYLDLRGLTVDSLNKCIGDKVIVVASIANAFGFLVLIDLLLLWCADVQTVIGVIFGYVFMTNGMMYIAMKATGPRSLGTSV